MDLECFIWHTWGRERCYAVMEWQNSDLKNKNKIYIFSNISKNQDDIEEVWIEFTHDSISGQDFMDLVYLSEQYNFEQTD